VRAKWFRKKKEDLSSLFFWDRRVKVTFLKVTFTLLHHKKSKKSNSKKNTDFLWCRRVKSDVHSPIPKKSQKRAIQQKKEERSVSKKKKKGLSEH
jgi:hypothetical protein